MAVYVCKAFLVQQVVTAVAMGLSLVQLNRERDYAINAHLDTVGDDVQSNRLTLNMSAHSHMAGKLPMALKVALTQTSKRLNLSEFTEDMYQEMASLRNDDGMTAFVKLVLAADNKYVPSEEEPKLAAFVPWFSGTKGVQSLAAMRQKLLEKEWVKEIVPQTTAPVVAVPEATPKTYLVRFQSVKEAPKTEVQHNQSVWNASKIEIQHNRSVWKAPKTEMQHNQSVSETPKIEIQDAQSVRQTPMNETQTFPLAKEPARPTDLATGSPSNIAEVFTEDRYQQVAALHDDAAMGAYAQSLLATENKFIAKKDGDEFAGFVQWFSGAKAIQTLTQMRQELASKSWVTDMQATFEAPQVTEAHYQDVAALQNDLAMSALVKKLLRGQNKFIANKDENELAGFVQWFSGTKATQSLAQMRQELASKNWVTDMHATLAAPQVTEAHYNAIAALQNDVAMSVLVKKLLKNENKFVPREEEGELAGFVQWFSGTKATQNLSQMRQELKTKSWVKEMQASTAASTNDGVVFAGMSANPAASLGVLITEAEYQQAAALHDNAAMSNFVKKVLASENKYVPEEEERELEGFVPWFSGTFAIQSLKQMREELSTKSWIKELPTPSARAADASFVSVFTNASHKTQLVPANVSTSSSSKDAKTRNMNSTSRLPFEGRADATCAECIISSGSRVLSFNAFRARLAEHTRRETLVVTDHWKEHGMFNSKEGTFWLVHSPSVKVQARYAVNAYHPEFTALQGIVVSGEFVGGNKLFISTLNGPVTWNEKVILNALPSKYSNKYFKAYYLKQSELVQSGGMGPALELSFANGLFLLINRWAATLAIRIHMCETHVVVGKQKGQCGSLEHIQHGRNQRLIGSASPPLLHEEILFPGIEDPVNASNASIPENRTNFSSTASVPQPVKATGANEHKTPLSFLRSFIR